MSYFLMMVLAISAAILGIFRPSAAEAAMVLPDINNDGRAGLAESINREGE